MFAVDIVNLTAIKGYKVLTMNRLASQILAQSVSFTYNLKKTLTLKKTRLESRKNCKVNLTVRLQFNITVSESYLVITNYVVTFSRFLLF
jgi:hypothetical protein